MLYVERPFFLCFFALPTQAVRDCVSKAMCGHHCSRLKPWNSQSRPSLVSSTCGNWYPMLLKPSDPVCRSKVPYHIWGVISVWRLGATGSTLLERAYLRMETFLTIGSRCLSNLYLISFCAGDVDNLLYRCETIRSVSKIAMRPLKTRSRLCILE